MKTLMKLATTALTAGLAAAAMPGYAADSGADRPPVQQAANEKQQESYIENAQNEMREWKDKVVAFGRDAKQEGREIGEDAAEKLDSAWDDVARKWDSLEEASKDAGEEGWQKAREAYEASKRKLQETWEDVTS